MVRMPKTVLLLLGVILYLCVVLVRIENQRYALWMGLCHSPYGKVLEQGVAAASIDKFTVIGLLKKITF